MRSSCLLYTNIYKYIFKKKDLEILHNDECVTFKNNKKKSWKQIKNIKYN